MLKRFGFIGPALLAPLLNVTVVFSLPIFAQAQSIEEIVVTARKKEESLQEVPISISAFSNEQMRARGISNNYEVASFTPNFNTVKLTGRDTDRPTIRGMTAPNSRGEPNASYFIDGVFVGRSISTTTTASMERFGCCELHNAQADERIYC
jgi:outer membrane receptor protein involved in Fe transport